MTEPPGDDQRARDARQALTAPAASALAMAGRIHWWDSDLLRALLIQAACPIVCVGHRQQPGDGPDWHELCEQKADAALAILAAPRPPSRSPLADMLATYLSTRQHTLSTAQMSGMPQLVAEAEYVLDEAVELRDAVWDLAAAEDRGETTAEHWRKVRHEIADVTLADTTLAFLMPGRVTVEACIVEKTGADRGRG